MDLAFDGGFWGLLPAFLIVTIIGAVETYGDGIAIQRVSHHQQRPVDFKAVQGAVNADCLGNLLCGIAGTVPNTTYSTSISVAELTRVASRRAADRVLLAPSLHFMPDLREFLDATAARAGWDKAATDRRQLAGEEALLYLVDRQSARTTPQPIRLAARPDATSIELQFASGPDAENVQARLDALALTELVP